MQAKKKKLKYGLFTGEQKEINRNSSQMDIHWIYEKKTLNQLS